MSWRDLSIVKAAKEMNEIPFAISLLWRAATKPFTITVISLIILGLVPIVTGIITKLIVDHLVASKGINNELWWLIFAEFSILLAATSLRHISNYSTAITRDRTTHMLRQEVGRIVAALDLEFFESPGNHDAFAKAQREIGIRPLIITTALLSAIQSAVTVVGFAIVVIAYQPIFAIALFFATLPSLLAQQEVASRRFSQHDLMTPDGRRAAYFDELLTKDIYAKEVRINNLAPNLLQWNKEYTDRILNSLRGVAANESLKLGRAEIFAVIMQYLGVVIIVYNAAIGNISVGGFTLLIAAVAAVRMGLGSFFASLGDVYESGIFFKNLTYLLNLKPKITAPQQPMALPQTPKKGIAFEGVTFAYPGTEKPVFKNFSLFLQAEQSTAIVGSNGAGKTTIVKLITRLYDPQEGRITLDGIDIRHFDPIEYRAKIAVILQDFARYQLSVLENIAQAGVENINPEIEQAASRSGALSIVRNLPEGWKTLLGRQFHIRGQELSGGQWQRIALARALYKDAPILILDEPTSALDAEAELEVFSQYRHLTSGRLSILVSHRFNTVQKVDRIIVIDEGRCVEDGSHLDLMKLDGKYAKLYNIQADSYNL